MADIRDIATLPLSRSIVDSLLKNGFRFVSDLKSIQPLELAQEIGTTPDVALTIIQCAESSFLNSSQAEKLQFSAKDLLTKCELSRPIISFCKAIDVMMGGGVQIGQITEFCGVPGVSCCVAAIEHDVNICSSGGKDATWNSTRNQCPDSRVIQWNWRRSHLH